MKKFLLSAGLIASFAAYVFHQRVGEVDLAHLTPAAKQLKLDIDTSASLGTATPTPVPATPTPPPPLAAAPSSPPRGPYSNDGTFTGPVTDAYYGYIQVQATVQNGNLTEVQFLQYPSDRRTSIEINTQAMPILRREALQAQSAQVDLVSGATDSSAAFRESLGAALTKAGG